MEDFPTLGSPTIPIFKLLETLPSRIFSVLTSFLGGILEDLNLDLEEKGEEDEKSEGD